MVLFGRDRLDAGEADLATILQEKAARIDHGGDAALALRLERASGCLSRTGRGGDKHQAARQCYRDKSAAPRFRSACRFHDELYVRSNFCMLAICQPAPYPISFH
jgi:hypothetical protein